MKFTRMSALAAAIALMSCVSGDRITGDTLLTRSFPIVVTDGSAVFGVSTDGNARKQFLADSTRLAFTPVCSPDGKQIAYLSIPSYSKSTESAQTIVTNVDGSGSKVLPVSGNPAWSPDGKRLAIVHLTGISIIDRDGTGLTTLTVPTYTSGANLTASWSPDGSEILYTGTAHNTLTPVGVWSVNVASGASRLVASNAYSGRWSRDGARIAYVEGFPGTPGSTLISISKNGDSRKVLLPYDNSDIRGLSFTWSPDGRQIIISRYGRLYAIDTGTAALTEFPFSENRSDNSPHYCGTP